ncbi:hypothetical protein P3X46_018847 [Hevea brasiliensis]|uniref:glucan endo-1,3-beta-D-glucosidase n=1 Tax=Hevea brasiliensis TaxID=3981 RepID=A0ABQ9LS32_HEVBR|nr:glucan endo-1,3-beta-glucosidase [Hevea brasiliensis]KAJ9170767.1 hypothetical protein P3X46_018847 [Hevea brasiliensis]
MFSPLFHGVLTYLLLSHFQCLAGAFPPIGIGVTHSRLANNLPSAKETIELCQQKGFQKIRLYKPHIDALEALKHSGMEVILGVANEDIVQVAFAKGFAQNWVNTYVKPYKTILGFTMIAVGHGISPGDKLAEALLPAMQVLKDALYNADPDLSAIYLTTPFQLNWLSQSYPPSAGTFDPKFLLTIQPIVEFLEQHSPFLLCDLYPYYAYKNNPDYKNISLDYALLSSSNVIVQDGGTGYTNMLDGLIDAFMSAMEKIGVTNVKVYVSETGWPISPGIELATPQNAETYIANVFKRLKAAAKSPKSQWPSQIFIYNLFLQNQAVGEQRNFGLFYPNKKPIYY